MPKSESPPREEPAVMSKPTAEYLLANKGAEGLTEYLEENPQSPKRIQEEMRNISLLGGCYNVTSDSKAATTA